MVVLPRVGPPPARRAPIRRYFELADDHIGGGEERFVPLDRRGRHVGVAAGDDHDRILAGVVDDDQRHARRRRRARAERRANDRLRFQPAPERRAVRIVADKTEHRDVRAEPGRRDRLVAALAARRLRERMAGEGFARLRQARRPGDEVHVQAADHDDVAAAIYVAGFAGSALMAVSSQYGLRAGRRCAATGGGSGRRADPLLVVRLTRIAPLVTFALAP